MRLKLSWKKQKRVCVCAFFHLTIIRKYVYDDLNIFSVSLLAHLMMDSNFVDTTLFGKPALQSTDIQMWMYIFMSWWAFVLVSIDVCVCVCALIRNTRVCFYVCIICSFIHFICFSVAIALRTYVCSRICVFVFFMRTYACERLIFLSVFVLRCMLWTNECGWLAQVDSRIAI